MSYNNHLTIKIVFYENFIFIVFVFFLALHFFNLHAQDIENDYHPSILERIDSLSKNLELKENVGLTTTSDDMWFVKKNTCVQVNDSTVRYYGTFQIPIEVRNQNFVLFYDFIDKKRPAKVYLIWREEDEKMKSKKIQ